MDKSLSVIVEPDMCSLMLMPDGLTVTCVTDGVAKVHMPPKCIPHGEVAVFVLDPNDSVVNVQRREIAHEELILQCPPSLQITWPQWESTITFSERLDIHFIIPLRSRGNNPGNDTYVCVDSISPQSESVVITLLDDQRLCVPSSDEVLSLFGKFVPDQYVITLYVVSENLDLYREIGVPPPDLNGKLISKSSVRFAIENYNEGNSILTSDFDLAPVIRVPMAFHSKIEEKFIDSKDFSDIIHVALMSVRSLDRYEEAEVMLKSLIFNMDRRTQMVIHLIVDKGGYQFMERIWRRYDLYNRIDNVALVFHDYHAVCDAPARSFLKKFSLPQSSHHSGLAGYCRLFMPQYFNDLQSMKSIIDEGDHARQVRSTNW